MSISTQPRCRILLVEDEELIREMMAEYLSREGYSVVEAASRNEALACLDREHFQLVIADVRLKGQDGLTVIDTAATRRVPVLAVSGEGTLQAMLQQRGHAFLAKPFRLDQLRQCIDEVLDRSRIP